MAGDVSVGILCGVYPQPLPLPDQAADLIEVGQGRAYPELLEPIEYYNAKWADEDEECDLPDWKIYDGEQACDDAGPYILRYLHDVYSTPHMQDRQQAANCDYSR